MAPVRLMRVNYVGELGWEIHHGIEYQNHLFDVLEEAGREFDMRLVGMRAMNWLRLEKSYRAWGAELSKEVTALESGLDRFVRLDKNSDFVGRAALEKQKASGALRWALVTLLIDGPADADPWGVEFDLGRRQGGGPRHRRGLLRPLQEADRTCLRAARVRLRRPGARDQDAARALSRARGARQPLRPGERARADVADVAAAADY